MGKRILLVDDEPLILKGLKYTLEQEGYETESAMDGEEALNKFDAQAFDLILLDVMMPKMDGTEATAAIHAKSPRTKIALLTSTSSSDDISRAIRAGASGAILKSADNIQLVTAIRTVAAGGEYISEEVSQQLAIELGKGNTNGINAIQKQLDILAEYGGASYAINERLDNDRLQLSLVKSKYEEAKVDATEFIPHKFVVTSAFTAERKSTPVRWVIVTVTVCSTFILLLFLIALWERYGNFFRGKTEDKSVEKSKES